MARRARAAALLESTDGEGAGQATLPPGVANEPPAFRTAQEIARTAMDHARSRPWRRPAASGPRRWPAPTCPPGCRSSPCGSRAAHWSRCGCGCRSPAPTRCTAARAEMLSPRCCWARVRATVNRWTPIWRSSAVTWTPRSIRSGWWSPGPCCPPDCRCCWRCWRTASPTPPTAAPTCCGERDRLVEHLAIAATQPSSVAHRFLQRAAFRRPSGRLGHARAGAGRPRSGSAACAGCTPGRWCPRGRRWCWSAT